MEVEELKTYFPVRGGIWLRSIATCKAVDGVSFQLMPGERWACRRIGLRQSTLGKSIVRLLTPPRGQIRLKASIWLP